VRINQVYSFSKYRLPILHTEFREYPGGIGPDYLVQKGIIYTKIRVHDTILHLFSTHTQASYSEDPKYFKLHVDQFICLRRFVTEMLIKNGYKKGDMTLIVGDFNVDARDPLLYDTKTMLGLCPVLKKFLTIATQEKFHEYDVLVSILTNDLTDNIEELLLNKFKEHPATFGDFYIDEHNNIRPYETVLTYTGGQTSSRRLDYIFHFSPKIHPKSQQDLGTEDETPNPKSKLSIRKESADIDKLLVQGKKFTQLSDHYGVQITLHYKNFGKSYENISRNQLENLSTHCIE